MERSMKGKVGTALSAHLFITERWKQSSLSIFKRKLFLVLVSVQTVGWAARPVQVASRRHARRPRVQPADDLSRGFRIWLNAWAAQTLRVRWLRRWSRPPYGLCIAPVRKHKSFIFERQHHAVF
jgi:hypothetical protein